MSLAQELIDNMEKIQPVIESLIATGDAHLEALKKNDLTLLNDVIQKQDLIIRDFKDIEKKIILGQQSLALELGFEEYKIEEVAEKINQSMATHLKAVQGETKIKLEKLKQTNELNNMIIKQNLAYTQKLMQMVGRLTDQSNSQTYSVNGQVKQEQNNTLINKQV